MQLRHSVGLAILSAIAVQGLLIPNIESLPSQFGANGDSEQGVLAHHGKHPKVDMAHHGKHPKIAKDSKGHPKLCPEALKKMKEGHPSAPVITTHSASKNLIPYSYIIVFKKGVTSEDIDFHRDLISTLHEESVSKLRESDPNHSFFVSNENGETGYTGDFSVGDLLKGYTGYFTDDTLELISKHPAVAFIERDSRVFATDFETQNGAPWGLARVSHRKPLSLGSFNKYLYDGAGGEGVTSYVIDTGIHVTHKEFQGRASWGKTIPAGDVDDDGNGHGTHCAGTIASESYGVAKKANVVAIKVLRSNGSGSMSDVLKGVEYATQSHLDAVKKGNKKFKGSTANMSLGGGKSPALDLAVNAAVKNGIHFAVAAGNENQDACNTSPAAAENAITVGASTLSDARAYFSNYGKCVDIFAPGLNILSTYTGSDDATATLSGTSMASPHIAGLLTYFLSLQPAAGSLYSNGGSEGVTPAQLKKNLLKYASVGVLEDVPEDTPNLLVYNGGGQNLSSFWGKETEDNVASSDDTGEFHSFVNKLESAVENLAQEFAHSVKELASELI
ncbi:Vacuolar proteinase B [Komagataella phaffii CBS 7435]|uniref:Vacuolar proteinase B (YscB), a serine protease of the subtilisin family n=2 Tax=Komagataella phaffii TaxID=460519 RepID=C4QWH2_KOMPG|nr:Vacuolar proteinase B (yscB), a serine protease of the subtilisin family [Komagataella phaffii GS115]AOA60634.1 GQ67_02808T0 [Komagataella phaffii]CAH2446271.1 Vacuolar proteinase B [Komagataella phaffii CBS 7435]AOA66357.1 GQ68_02440T0 [Komagataella phaffii GS115]CAY67595.1 Vacuolar proteinase B (yscB), a serine protease of the subtilisin family [Komagataella phaffii GS115]CCA36690.1 Vacuolar proteinase B [Komagataella phaffii CBS 7435]